MLRDIKQFFLPEIEEKVLSYWKENQIFEKSVNKKRSKTFVFYEGPPTANGKPGIHHVLARSFKDIVLRYKTMRGYSVPRRAGWDTHGLPVEIAVEKELGLKSKKEIETYGVAEFNKKCKESVWKYKEDWERLTERIGFWLDMKNPYITYEASYMETLWWILQSAWKKKLLYKGHRIVPWCTRCGTALSSHELAQGYHEVTDTSVYVKFRIKNNELRIKGHGLPVYILSWTTTPWTLPGNVALAVGEDIDYVAIQKDGEILIAAKESPLGKEVSESGEVKENLKGKDLIGLEYESLFEVPFLKGEKSYRVYAADFVTTTDGTGVVHTAVMYGEDDYKLGSQIGLPQAHTVDEEGRFVSQVGELKHMYAKAPETESKIIELLSGRGFLLKKQPYTHEYPFCWRCDTPLLYYARESWFIRMSSLRDKLIEKNKNISWTPEHLQEGRFGEWLREVKDWNLSRERFWGTPLPVWECSSCGETEVIGGVSDLKKKGIVPNEFFFIRHGESDHNVKRFTGPADDSEGHASNLTEKGREQVARAARSLRSKKIDIIITSPLKRAKETAEIVGFYTGARIITSELIREINPGSFVGKTIAEHNAFFKNRLDRFNIAPEGGETWREVMRRLAKFVKEVQENHPGKKIVVVSHGDPLWILKGMYEAKSKEDFLSVTYPKVGKIYPISVSAVPFNTDGEVDIHKPFIDSVLLKCPKCSDSMRRVKEIIDVWFDSGGMPFAQAHFPFSKKLKLKGGSEFKFVYPADYICEAVDQTRGWFYTLLAEAVVLGKPAPYKNVISLGHVLDKNGQKMSKSKGNVIDPWDAADRHGVDVIRWYFYTVNDPGEPKRFNEADVMKTYRSFHLLAYNSYSFLRTYLSPSVSKTDPKKSPNILDKWILVLWNETITSVTASLEKYQIGTAAKALDSFLGDLSRWYIRRSRKRFSDSSSEDFAFAAATLTFVLRDFSKALAPFCPFISEAIYKSIINGAKEKGELSVHLEDWPKFSELKRKPSVISEMEEVRNIANLALAARTTAGIKVKQPLAALVVKNQNSKIKGNQDLIDVLKDEVNVKEVVFNSSITEEVELDTNITPELYEEGMIRELTRLVQQVRQDAKYKVTDIINLSLFVYPELKTVIQKHMETFKKTVKAKDIDMRQFEEERRGGVFDAEVETEFEGKKISVAVRKIS
ncbi:MAG: isoleucine--tRNA ligase [Candidatus Harrisonbacteria bacterium CG10_big_fil_rev_8_21_14_0_10_40_38]|uniref:Isoleucine--tRNA ligase n=1 Tax=Candidatus Harrisonbacteria bacterium CG10_big_fil_rev_8_21_14_0_10_40_38 TaxID=1974583 RepID=A0A2H0URN3_9BACT|nr:MAG: isoleucine--tRNA ligase [Candidatus Harrisonbacteria bacterium CG10_big_fil_rev_8_21_14_0_10_40_38]